jgi:hypothetical protein
MEKTGTNSNTRFPQASCFKKTYDVCKECGGGKCNVDLWSTKGMRKRDKKSNSRAAEKGAKKLVSSNCAKILEKKVAVKRRETCEKTMFTPSNQKKATNPIVAA